MHKWIKTADAFYDHFCQQTLAIHAKAFNVETGKHKKKNNYVLRLQTFRLL